MRNLLALIGLAVVGFGVGGWYLGWYKLSFTRTPDGNLQINANIDAKKVGADTKKASDEFPDLLNNLGSAISSQVDKTAQDAKAPHTTPGVMPGPVVPAQNLTPLPPLPSVPVAPVAAPTTPAPIPLRAPGQY